MSCLSGKIEIHKSIFCFNLLKATVHRNLQVISEHGVMDENIIVMMYDDIAESDMNPYPGDIFNGPYSFKQWPYGPDVYKGVPKDYTGNEIDRM